jgi:hypothetical protein
LNKNNNSCKNLEQVSHFKYLGGDVSWEYQNNIQQKLKRFQNICGMILRISKKKTRKETLLKLCKVMAVPVLMYGSE